MVRIDCPSLFGHKPASLLPPTAERSRVIRIPAVSATDSSSLMLSGVEVEGSVQRPSAAGLNARCAGVLCSGPIMQAVALPLPLPLCRCCPCRCVPVKLTGGTAATAAVEHAACGAVHACSSSGGPPRGEESFDRIGSLRFFPTVAYQLRAADRSGASSTVNWLMIIRDACGRCLRAATRKHG